jgi:hypothetical protein
MPLQDHFRPPLSARRHWHAFHSAWATYLSSQVNRYLPQGYFAEPNVQFGIEIDVASFEEANGVPSQWSGPVQWSPPAPLQTVPFAVITDFVEVTIFHTEGGPTLAGAIELVSPANKDRPEHRDAFVAKCQTLLQQGIGLLVVDVVTARRANLHTELMARLQVPNATLLNADLYAVAYHPVSREGEPHLDLWPVGLAVGQPLPTMPLWLRGGLSLPVELEATYERTCLEQRVTANGVS